MADNNLENGKNTVLNAILSSTENSTTEKATETTPLIGSAEPTEDSGWLDGVGRFAGAMGGSIVDNLADSNSLGARILGGAIRSGLGELGAETEGYRYFKDAKEFAKMQRKSQEDKMLTDLIENSEKEQEKLMSDNLYSQKWNANQINRYMQSREFQRLQSMAVITKLRQQFNSNNDPKYIKAIDRYLAESNLERKEVDGKNYLVDKSGKMQDIELTEENINNILNYAINEDKQCRDLIFGGYGDVVSVEQLAVQDVIDFGVSNGLSDSPLEMMKEYTDFMKPYGREAQSIHFLVKGWDAFIADGRITNQEKEYLSTSLMQFKDILGLKVNFNDEDVFKSTVIQDGKNIPISDFMASLKQNDQIGNAWNSVQEGKLAQKQLDDSLKEKQRIIQDYQLNQVIDSINNPPNDGDSEQNTEDVSNELTKIYGVNYATMENKEEFEDFYVNFVKYTRSLELNEDDLDSSKLDALEELDSYWNENMKKMKVNLKSPVADSIANIKKEQKEQKKATRKAEIDRKNQEYNKLSPDNRTQVAQEYVKEQESNVRDVINYAHPNSVNPVNPLNPFGSF